MDREIVMIQVTWEETQNIKNNGEPLKRV